MAEPSAELAALLKRQSLKFEEAENPPEIEGSKKSESSPDEQSKGSAQRSQDKAGYPSQKSAKAPESAKPAGRETLGFGAKRPQLSTASLDLEAVVKRVLALAQGIDAKKDEGSITSAVTKLSEELGILKDAATSSAAKMKQQDAEIARLKGQQSAGQSSEGSSQEVQELRAELDRKDKQIEASSGSVKEKERLRTELEKVAQALAEQKQDNETLKRDLALAKKRQDQALEDKNDLQEQLKTVTEARDKAQSEIKAARREAAQAAAKHGVTALREAEEAACREADELQSRLAEAQQEELAAQAESEIRCELAEARGAKAAHEKMAEEMASFETSAGLEEAPAPATSESPSELPSEEVSRSVAQLEDEFANVGKQADRLEEEQKKRRDEIAKLLAEE